MRCMSFDTQVELFVCSGNYLSNFLYLVWHLGRCLVLCILMFHRKYKSIRNIRIALYFTFHTTAKKVSSLWLITNLSFGTTALS